MTKCPMTSGIRVTQSRTNCTATEFFCSLSSTRQTNTAYLLTHFIVELCDSLQYTRETIVNTKQTLLQMLTEQPVYI